MPTATNNPTPLSPTLLTTPTKEQSNPTLDEATIAERVSWIKSISPTSFARLQVYASLGQRKATELLQQAHSQAVKPTHQPTTNTSVTTSSDSNMSKSKGDGKGNNVSSPSDLKVSAAPSEQSKGLEEVAIEKAGVNTATKPTLSTEPTTDNTPKDPPIPTLTSTLTTPTKAVLEEESSDTETDEKDTSPDEPDAPNRKQIPKKPSDSGAFGVGLSVKVNARTRAQKVAAAAVKTTTQQ